MPLPLDTNLTLQGYSKPGDTQCSQPKSAMLFRMSHDAMDRLADPLQSHKVSVVFGDKPGLLIGDEHFPFRISPESQAHELYLLSQPKHKTATGLKLYANIDARAHFVDRKLDPKTSSSVRERTEAAEKQRTGAKIKILETPPPRVVVKSVPAAKKRKDATAPVRKISAVSASSALSVPSSSQPSRMASPGPAPPTSTKNVDPGLRRRFIHFVALQPRTTSEIKKAVFGTDKGNAEHLPALQHLPGLQEELCERVPTPKGSSDEKWQLKTKSWLEVRPYTFPGLDENEQTSLARHARAAFHALKIPQSDPTWEHARVKVSSGSSAVASGSGTSSTAKRPAMSDQRKTKLSETAAAKKKANDIIIAKDEGSRVKAEKAAAAAEASSASSSRPPLRRPGSGYVAKTHTPTPPAVDVPPKRETKKEAPPRPLHPPAQSSREPGREQRPVASSAVTRPVKKEREVDGPSRVATSDKGSRRDSPLPLSSNLKRKKVRDDRDREPDEYAPPTSKRRKVEDESATKARAPRDLTLPKRPAPPDNSAMPPPRKYKKESSSTPTLRAAAPSERSPMPSHASRAIGDLLPVSIKHDNDASARSSSIASRRSRDEHSRNGSAKLRRKSPVYTSSDEDEDEVKTPEEPAPKVKREDESPKPKFVAEKVPLVIPDDPREVLRLYDKIYPDYVALYYKTGNHHKRLLELEAMPVDKDDPEGLYVDDEDAEIVYGFADLWATFTQLRDELLELRQAYEDTYRAARRRAAAEDS